ncbi:MAG: C40 family peptidase [Desulfovibrionaceae bacterium]|jgi:hypothetical protein|nr:C40 family peptidase [Desulfovibrionaceae bacterium]
MSRKKLVALILLAAALPAAHAAPGQDGTGELLTEKGLIPKISQSISHATDRAAELVITAIGSLGVPYRWGGTSAETGFDCSGFVRAMFQQTTGQVLPRRAADQAMAGAKIDKREIEPGDLVFFNTRRRGYSHVGIYIGEGRFIHSPRTGLHVVIENMNIRYWQSRFNGARRVLTGEPAAADIAADTAASPDSPALATASPDGDPATLAAHDDSAATPTQPAAETPESQNPPLVCPSPGFGSVLPCSIQAAVFSQAAASAGAASSKPADPQP